MNLQELQKLAKQYPPREKQKTTGNIGELIMLPSEDGSIQRIVLIVGKIGNRFKALLATNELDMATEWDIIVPGNVSEARYDLLIQGELYGRFVPKGEYVHIGTVPVQMTQDVAEALKSDAVSLKKYGFILPLVYANDPRRAFKQSELDDLYKIMPYDWTYVD